MTDPKGKLVISEEDLEGSEPATEAIPEAPTPQTYTPKKSKAKKVSSPPESDPQLQAHQSWARRNRKALMIGAGGVLALALGFLVAFVALGLLDSSEASVSDSLADGNASMTEAFSEVESASRSARKFTSLKEAASAAGDEVENVRTASTELRSSVDDGALANPALELLADEQAFLVRLSSISGFSDDEIMNEWKELRPRLRSLQREIESDGEAVADLGLDSSKPVIPEKRQVTGTINAAGQILVKTDQVLSEWRVEVERIQEQQNAEVSAAESYKSQMSSLIEQYFQQRDETRALMERSAVPYNEASQALRSQASAREGIVSQMQALTPPANAASAHSEMVGLATESKTLLLNAAETTETDPFPIWTGTPGYNTLSQGSDSISSRYEPAKQAVLSAADSAIQQAQNQASSALPPKPKV